MKQVLIVDIGTGGIHTCLVDAMGFLTGNAYEEIAYIHDPSINGYEFDALELFAMIKRSLSATLKKSSDVSSDIVALAVTSQRHGCVFLDADDRPLAAYPNVDARSEAESDLLKKTSGSEIYRRTARWPDCWFPLPRLLWLKNKRPELYDKIAALMMINEYAVFRLCGERVAEWTNAAETLFFDIRSRSWSQTMVDAYDLGRIRLNSIAPTGSAAGNLTPDLADELGLGRIPVVIAASDTQSAALGSGNVQPGEAVAVNGSTTPLFMPLAKFMIDEQRRVYTDPYYGDSWALEGNCNQTGIVHRRLMDQLLSLIRRLPGQEKARREDLYELFAGPDADAEGVTMHWGPLVSNICKHHKLSRLFLTSASNEINVFMSIIPAYSENVAFAIHENAKQLAAIAGVASGCLILTGGGSPNKLLQRILAALNPDKDICLTRELETTSRGAAIQAWIAIGKYDSLADAYQAMPTGEWRILLPKADMPEIRDRHRQWREEQPD